MNIQKTLNKLHKKMIDQEIADNIGWSQSMVWRLRNGKHVSTKHEMASKIKELAIAYKCLVL